MFFLDVPLCETQPLKKVQNDFLIDRMLKDDDDVHFSSQYRSTNLNSSSSLVTPSSDQRDIDTLSDAGTYIIEDDADIAQDDEPEGEDVIPPTNDPPTPSPFRRYVSTKRHRHGTFDLRRITIDINNTDS